MKENYDDNLRIGKKQGIFQMLRFVYKYLFSGYVFTFLKHKLTSELLRVEDKMFENWKLPTLTNFL